MRLWKFRQLKTCPPPIGSTTTISKVGRMLTWQLDAPDPSLFYECAISEELANQFWWLMVPKKKVPTIVLLPGSKSNSTQKVFQNWRRTKDYSSAFSSSISWIWRRYSSLSIKIGTDYQFSLIQSRIRNYHHNKDLNSNHLAKDVD
jgi:hypothetical protein